MGDLTIYRAVGRIIKSSRNLGVVAFDQGYMLAGILKEHGDLIIDLIARYYNYPDEPIECKNKREASRMKELLRAAGNPDRRVKILITKS